MRKRNRIRIRILQRLEREADWDCIVSCPCSPAEYPRTAHPLLQTQPFPPLLETGCSPQLKSPLQLGSFRPWIPLEMGVLRLAEKEERPEQGSLGSRPEGSREPPRSQMIPHLRFQG